MIEKRSYCRLCHGMCGMVVTVDEAGLIAQVRGDKDNALTRGYACIKGLQAPELHNGPKRLRAHHVRTGPRIHKPIEFDAAIEAIAARLRIILDTHGPASVAIFTGTQSAYNALYRLMAVEFLKALGSPSRFGTMTIDQSAKWVAAGRLGTFGAPLHGFRDSDVWLMTGINPMVSLAGSSAAMPPYDPVKQIKDARAGGMKLIVIDPVETQTAKNADLFLQPVPGQDAAIFAGLLNIVLSENWHDAAFCAEHVEGLDALRDAVSPFTAAHVAERAGLAADDLVQAARMFAHEGRRGCAGGGTGPNMAPHSNLAEHLIECLNIVCGRYYRAGDVVPEQGLFHARRLLHADVTPPARSWERGPKSASGHGTMNKEMMSGVLADEILGGSIRALFCIGSNPANALPDQVHAVRALESIDLLVTSDAVWSETARLAHYVFAATQPFERPDHTYFAEELGLQLPFAQYTPAIVDPPPGFDVIDDWYPYYALAQKLGIQLRFAGRDLSMTEPPSSDELLAMLVERGSIPLDAVMRHSSGAMFEIEPQHVEPARPGAGRFDVMPLDVQAEVAEMLAGPQPPVRLDDGTPCTHLLVSRRHREVMNSYGRELTAIRDRMPHNPAYIHPADLVALGIEDGERVLLRAEAGAIEAVAQADASIRPGVVSIAHGWGRLPGERDDYAASGSSTTRLVARDRAIETINAMPRLSAIPIMIERQPKSS